jgi:hypothetical protein
MEPIPLQALLNIFSAKKTVPDAIQARLYRDFWRIHVS